MESTLRYYYNNKGSKPVVSVRINDVPLRALIDTGAYDVIWCSNNDNLFAKCGLHFLASSNERIKGITGSTSGCRLYQASLSIGDFNWDRIFIRENRKEIVNTKFDIILGVSLFTELNLKFMPRYNMLKIESLANKREQEMYIDTSSKAGKELVQFLVD